MHKITVRVRPMKPTLIVPFVLAVLLAGCLAWAEYTSWREVVDLQRQLEAPELKRLLESSKQWAPADREALQEMAAEAHRSLNGFRTWLLASTLAMLLLAAVITRTVRREMIAPLASKLVESHAVIARHEKLAALGLLAAGVAHEIRNPLVAIKARLFSQKKKLARGSPEFSDAEFINDEINRLEQIVRNFLLFARPADPCLQPVNAVKFLKNIIELMEPEADRRSISLALDAAPGITARMDPAQMKQLIINLVRNAIESIGRGGTVILRAREAFLSTALRRSPAVALDVEDNGPGIPESIQARIFDPFFTTKDAGTGLGLPIAERIAEKHGGSLQYHSRRNRTLFTVTVPAASESEGLS